MGGCSFHDHADDETPLRPKATFALSILIRGIVQGVGFRPFIYNLAKRFNVAGWVLNATDGVHIHAEGSDVDVVTFLRNIKTMAPPMARIDSLEYEECKPEGFPSFAIRMSERDFSTSTLISPDIATCPQCEAELFDPTNRRYHYPFINCTQCGPRFTIIDSLPYDRANTSMQTFEMCYECGSEFIDPSNRRFHAQPNACFSCGPELSWRFTDGPTMRAYDLTTSDMVIEQAAAIIEQGGIVAIKGLGGYHLACDASNKRAVLKLRERKRRPHKPFAVMVPGMEDAKAICEVSPAEERLLSGSVRPIVLLQRKKNSLLAPGVASGLREIGVMLPYTPLQHLLLHRIQLPLVMTSGNLSEEPILSKDDEAAKYLSPIADAFLSNDRPILSRYDDSVVRVLGDDMHMVRRARGYAPTPIPLPESLRDGPELLACGPEQKNTFCFTRDGYAYISQHLGDLENALTFQVWEQTVKQYRHLFDLHPERLVCDMHPEYLSTKWAHEHDHGYPRGIMEIQHHHAHIAAVTAEHDHPGNVVGVALDGTGYGDDGTIWGGEIVLCDWAHSKRLACISPFELPGGSAAIQHPSRIAWALLRKFGLTDHPGAHLLKSQMDAEELSLCDQMLEKHLNCPLTSSAGRLLDAVAAICGICTKTTYDGEPAIALEAALYDDVSGETTSDAEATDALERYRFDLAPATTRNASTSSATPVDAPTDTADTAPLLIEPALAIKASLDDVYNGVSRDLISLRFHTAFANAIVEVCKRAASQNTCDTVALSGGVFMNLFLLTHIRSALEETGFTVLTGEKLPANDGCISYGQAVIALARLQEEYEN